MTESTLFARASLKTLKEDLAFLKNHGLLPEVYLPAETLDGLDDLRLAPLQQWREDGGEISLHAPFMDLSPGGLDRRVLEVTRLRFSQAQDIAEKVRPVNVVFHSGYDKWRYGFREDLWLDNSIAIWSELVEWGDRVGCRIVLENVFDVRPDHMVRLRERVGPSLGFCFDSGHYLIFSEFPLTEWLEALGAGLAELHLHDNEGNRDSHMPVGDGIFDFKVLLSHLDRTGIEPVMVLEHHSRRETVRSAENFRRLLAACRKTSTRC